VIATSIMLFPSCSAIFMKSWFWNMPLMALMYFEGSNASPGSPAGGGAAAPSGDSRACCWNMDPNCDCKLSVTLLKLGSPAICSAICLMAGSCVFGIGVKSSSSLVVDPSHRGKHTQRQHRQHYVDGWGCGTLPCWRTETAATSDTLTHSRSKLVGEHRSQRLHIQGRERHI